MSSKQVTIKCNRCGYDILQEIIIGNPENYIYCPGCDNVFNYVDIQVINNDDSDDESSQVIENMKKAYDEIPHTFFKTESIYMKGFINGSEINFLLDTGAEISIIPHNIVEACGLTNILDTKYKGKMKGVGEADITGRIHYVEVVLDCGVYPCSFTACSNNDVPPILGIDMMHNLGISIDFKNKKIHFTPSCSVDFMTKPK